MTATLTFNLDEVDDAMSHMRCVKSLNMALFIWEFAGKLRDIVDTSEDGKYIDEVLVWDAWSECLEKNGIKLDEIII